MENDAIDIEKRNKSYNDYVKTVTPKKGFGLKCVNAFVVGGAICLLGQVLVMVFMKLGCNKEDAVLFEIISLVFLSALLTGLNIYPRITKFGGAGSLVPITGFANSVAAPAIEYKKEGRVFGIGCKIFTIAGPVILYGILVSWCLGLIYWVVNYVIM